MVVVVVVRSNLFKVLSTGPSGQDTKLLLCICRYKANISIQIPTNEDPVVTQAEVADQTEQERMGTIQTSQYPSGHFQRHYRPQPLSLIVWIGPLTSADIKRLKC